MPSKISQLDMEKQIYSENDYHMIKNYSDHKKSGLTTNDIISEE